MKKKDFVERAPSSRRTNQGWSEWSPCSSGTESTQVRHKICGDKRICGRDVRACDSTIQDPNMGNFLSKKNI